MAIFACELIHFLRRYVQNTISYIFIPSDLDL